MAPPAFSSRVVRANGLSVPILEQGEGPLLVCLHGFPDTAHTFHHQLRSFAAAGYHVVAPAMRGYAPGTIPERGSYQSAALAEDVLALIDALGHERATVYGHDWGTAAAYGAALRDPGKITRLVASAVPYGPGFPTALVTSPLQQRRSWYVFYFQTRLAELAVPLSDFAFIEALWRDWSPGAKVDEAVLGHTKAALAEPGVLAAALAYYRTALDPTLRDPSLDAHENRFGVDPIRVPTLYVHGERDGCIGVETTEGMEGLFPGGFRRVILPGVGHFTHREDPAGFDRAVLDFLRG